MAAQTTSLRSLENFRNCYFFNIGGKKASISSSTSDTWQRRSSSQLRHSSAFPFPVKHVGPSSSASQIASRRKGNPPSLMALDHRGPPLSFQRNDLRSSSFTRFYSTQASDADYNSATRKAGWEGESPQELEERSEWVSWFKGKRLNRSSCEVSFSRSSGAGGQHVNKVETKALIKLNLDTAMARGKGWNRIKSGESQNEESEEIGRQSGWLLFSVGVRLIENSPYYIKSSHSIQISSMRTRSRDQNLEDAFQKLHEHLLVVSSDSLPSSDRDAAELEKQKLKVQRLKAREERKMKKIKEKRGQVKSGRKGGKGDLGW